MLGSNKVVPLNRVTFVEPGFRDDISRVKKIFREKKEFGCKRVNREQPGVPDLYPLWNGEVFLGARVSVVTNTLNKLIVARSEDFIKVSRVTNGNT